jgi:hypothetical protein
VEFRKAIELRPALFDAQYHLGVTEFLRRDYEAALLPFARRSPSAAARRGPLLSWCRPPPAGHLDSAIEELTPRRG